MSQQSTGLSKDERKTKRRSPALPAADDPEALLNSTHVRQMLGGVTRMTLYRWVKEGTLPQPDVAVGCSRYWQRKTILAHIEAMKVVTPAIIKREAEQRSASAAAMTRRRKGSSPSDQPSGANTAVSAPPAPARASGNAVGATSDRIRG
jgi:predicted DNA-binding transcriptional regulator AlpA